MPPTYLFAAIAVMIALHFILPLAKVIAFPWNLSGLISFVLGIVINIVADKAFKRHKRQSSLSTSQQPSS